MVVCLVQHTHTQTQNTLIHLMPWENAMNFFKRNKNQLIYSFDFCLWSLYLFLSRSISLWIRFSMLAKSFRRNESPSAALHFNTIISSLKISPIVRCDSSLWYDQQSDNKTIAFPFDSLPGINLQLSALIENKNLWKFGNFPFIYIKPTHNSWLQSQQIKLKIVKLKNKKTGLKKRSSLSQCCF